MTSRSAQIRMLLQSVPRSERGANVSDAAVQSRCEADLAAVDVWAAQGNSRQVKQAGAGLVALCLWHAMQSLSHDASPLPFQRASGLSPAQFAASRRELDPALSRAASSWASSSSTSLATTPQKPKASTAAAATPTTKSSSSHYAILPNLSPAERTPEALAKRARDIASGAATLFGAKRSPATPTFARTHQASPQDKAKELVTAGTSPSSTPSRSGLRDRSAIREKEVYDPSPAPPTTTTPTKRRGRPPGSTSRSGAASSPQTPSKRVRPSLLGPQTPSKQARTGSAESQQHAGQVTRPSGSRSELPVLSASIPSTAPSLVYPMTLGYKRLCTDADDWQSDAAEERVQGALQRVLELTAENDAGSNSAASGVSLAEQAQVV